MAMRGKQAPLDGGYGWVVVSACTFLHFMAASKFVAPGVFLLDLVEAFKVPKTQVVLINTFSLAASGVFGLFSGTLVKHLGCRKVALICGFFTALGAITSAFSPNIYTLYITKGCLEGLCTATVGVTTMVVTAEYVDKKKGFAMSMRTVGTGVGVFVWPPVQQALIDRYTWRGAMLIMGGMQLNSLAIAFLLIPRVSANKNTQKTKWRCSMKALFNYTLLKNSILMLFVCAVVASGVGHTTPMSFLPSLARQRGVSPSNSAWLVSVFGICSCIVRPIYGIVADKIRNQRKYLFAGSILVTGALVAGISQLHTFVMLAVISGLCGMASSCYIVLTPTVLSDIIPAQEMATAGGLISSVYAAVSLATSPLAGWMVDATNDFGVPFIAYGALEMCSSLLIVAMIILQRIRKENREMDNQNSPEEIDTLQPDEELQGKAVESNG